MTQRWPHPHTSPQECLQVQTPQQQGPDEDRALKGICACGVLSCTAALLLAPGLGPGTAHLPRSLSPPISVASLQARGGTSLATVLPLGLCGQRPASHGGLPAPLSNTSLRTPQDPAFSPGTSHAAGFPCSPVLCCHGVLPEGRDCCRLGSLLCPAQNLTRIRCSTIAE